MGDKKIDATDKKIDATSGVERVLRVPGTVRSDGKTPKVLSYTGIVNLDDLADPVEVFDHMVKKLVGNYPTEPTDSKIETYLESLGITDVADYLVKKHGWEWVSSDELRRPDSTSGSPSGILYVGQNKQLGITIRTSGVPELESLKWYSLAHLFVAMEHAGDWTAASIACRYEFPDDLGDDDSTTSTVDAKRIKPIPVSQLFASNPTMRPVVVDGILRRGETANIIAAAKVGKSHLAHGLAWCVVSGTPWLSHAVTQGRVLIIDNELHTETLSSRLSNIANSMIINPNDYEHSIDVISLRGQNVDIHSIEKQLDTIEPGTYTLTIIDALYRTLPSGTSENDNAQMMCIYNKLDHYAAQWDCAIAVVHHASKGAQGDKTITDVGAGAGSISRAADTHMVIRPHEEPELSVLECVTRSFKSPEPVTIRFDWPLWSPVDGVLPNVKKTVQSREERQLQQDDKSREELLDIFASVPGKPIRQQKLIEVTGYSSNKLTRILNIMAKGGFVKRLSKTKKEGGKPTVFWKVLS